MTASSAPPSAVRTYLTAVRARLDDLDVETQEDLLEGLDADLSELAAESDEPLERRLGDPARYADELRSAAGLAPRATGKPRRGAQAVDDRVTAAWRDFEGDLRRQSWFPAVAAFFVTLRPVWWVARAWVAVQLVDRVIDGHPYGLVPDIGGTGFGFLLLVAAVVLSVELGRGRWRDRRSAQLVVVGNVLAAVALLPVLSDVEGDRTVYVGDGVVSYDGQSHRLTSDVRNIFPYDAQGRPLTGVQLFDQDGRPVDLAEEARARNEDDESGPGCDLRAPGITAVGERWNVFPLRQVSGSFLCDEGVESEEAVRKARETATQPPPPHAAVHPVVPQASPAPSGSPALPQPSGTPQPSVTPQPSASAQPSTSPRPTGTTAPSAPGTPQPTR